MGGAKPTVPGGSEQKRITTTEYSGQKLRAAAFAAVG